VVQSEAQPWERRPAANSQDCIWDEKEADNQVEVASFVECLRHKLVLEAWFAKEEKEISTRSTPIPAVYADPRLTLSMTATE
jgi:hypothetical protein